MTRTSMKVTSRAEHTKPTTTDGNVRQPAGPESSGGALQFGRGRAE